VQKVNVHLKKNKINLLPEKGLFLPSTGILLLADLHLGKANHFRRAGIAVPDKTNKENLERLIKLLQKLLPTRVIFMGDLFHSHYNKEWEVFGQTLKNFPQISFELVRGNHDILSDYQYLKHQLIIHENPIEINNLLISHEPLDTFDADLYNLAGHIHPGVRLRGRGRQGIKLPCFLFGENQGLLPAFGAFTGLANQKPIKGDKVFVVVEGEIIAVQGTDKKNYFRL